MRYAPRAALVLRCLAEDTPLGQIFSPGRGAGCRVASRPPFNVGRVPRDDMSRCPSANSPILLVGVVAFRPCAPRPPRGRGWRPRVSRCGSMDAGRARGGGARCATPSWSMALAIVDRLGFGGWASGQDPHFAADRQTGTGQRKAERSVGSMRLGMS